MSEKESQRGFASMDPERHRKIASAGGTAAHRLKTAHEFSKAEARNAGRLGGKKVSEDRAHMERIGRKGGEATRFLKHLTTENWRVLSHLARGGTVEHECGAETIRLLGDGAATEMGFYAIAPLLHHKFVDETANPPESHTCALVRLTAKGARAVRSRRERLRKTQAAGLENSPRDYDHS